MDELSCTFYELPIPLLPLTVVIVNRCLLIFHKLLNKCSTLCEDFYTLLKRNNLILFLGRFLVSLAIFLCNYVSLSQH